VLRLACYYVFVCACLNLKLIHTMKRIDETDTIENERPVWDLYGPDPILGEIIKIPPEAELDLQAELEKRHYTQSEIDTLISVFGRHVIHLPHIKESPKGEAKYKDVSVETVWDLPRFIISKGELNKQFPNPLSGGKIRPNELAGGGQGILIDAYDMNLGMHVVAKAFNPVFYTARTPAFINSRLINEAITTARQTLLDEDVSIATVYDGGLLPTTDDRILMPFFVMRKIDGFSLDKAGTYELHTALDITNKLARAIDKLNADNIHHCDIKPGNIMLGRNGKLYLIDWGTSLDNFNKNLFITESGTPPFRAPEQATGIVTNETDQHALAATTWNLIKGQPPLWKALFRIGLPEREYHEYEHIDDKQELVKPDTMNDKVFGVFARAMSYNPEDRYKSCIEFAKALKDAYEMSQTN